MSSLRQGFEILQHAYLEALATISQRQTPGVCEVSSSDCINGGFHQHIEHRQPKKFPEMLSYLGTSAGFSETGFSRNSSELAQLKILWMKRHIIRL